MDFGITVYVTGCGGSASDATTALEAALDALAGAILDTSASA
jgi:predicted small secreted protein